jgi:hypothetical protein
MPSRAQLITSYPDGQATAMTMVTGSANYIGDCNAASNFSTLVTLVIDRSQWNGKGAACGLRRFSFLRPVGSTHLKTMIPCSK